MTDLHMHSTASDGTDSPKELLNKVQEAGITVFSLTDHDTIEGVEEIEPLIPKGLTFIRGIEFSCITKAGKCHILGYGYDKDNPLFLDNMGSYYLVVKHDSKKALRYYNKVLKKHPDDLTAIRNCILLARNDKDIKLEKRYLEMLSKYG